MKRSATFVLTLICLSFLACARKEKGPVFTAQEAREIARDAYVYGFPMVDNYRIMYAYNVDASNPEYKGGFNEIHSVARVYTPADKAIQTPNSDTPYSMLTADLRAEPVVITVPEVEPKRYYSAQFIDLYTQNFAYIGSRTTGNAAANFLLAGPDWKGETPPGIKDVIRCETQLAMVAFRTQLFDPSDIDKVKTIQDGYRLHTLSQFLNQPAPATAPEIPFVKPLSVSEEHTSLGFFNILNFVLQFCPTHPSETALMERFAKIDVGAGKNFNGETMKPEILQAIKDGMKDAWAIEDSLGKKMDAGEMSSRDLFGTREYLKNNYAYRMAAAVWGIYGNSAEEAMYPSYRTDSRGEALSGANQYVLHFGKDEIPPVNASWSITMYEMPQSLLYDNALDRYLINSSMLPKLKKDKDGGITIYIQHASPGPKLQSNWLPAPAGPFAMAMRLYWPKPEALDGTWKAPLLQRM